MAETLNALHAALADLEPFSLKLEPSANEVEHVLHLVSDFSRRFLQEMPTRPAWEAHPIPPRTLSEPIPVEPKEFKELLEVFSKNVLAGGVNPTSGRFVGYVPGGGLPIAAVGDYLAALTNKYSGIYYASPGAANLENTTIEWLRDMIGYPATAWGTLQSGGSLATLTAVVAARETRPHSEWAKSTVYLTAECHLAIAKALHIAGLGHVPQRKIAVDSRFRLSLPDLKRQIADDKAKGLKPWIVFASAGTVNSGAVDPLDDLAAAAHAEKMWLHVDAAYGGFFVLCDPKRELLAPMSKADSIVLDPHKGLFLPYGCGAVLVRDGGLLRKSLVFRSDYLPSPDSEIAPSPTDYSPELTRHFRALRLWLSLKVHGLNRLRAALNEKLILAQLAYRMLEDVPQIELGPPPELSCVAFRVKGSEEKTAALHAEILARGRVFLSPTRLNGEQYLRICVLCFRTHRSDVEEIIEEVRSHSFIV